MVGAPYQGRSQGVTLYAQSHGFLKSHNSRTEGGLSEENSLAVGLKEA